MASLTIRNIPERALERLRERAAAERRSLNNEIIVLLEEAVQPTPPVATNDQQAPATAQLPRWEQLCGRWRDDRSWEEIAADIGNRRTAGREVAL